MRDPEVERIAQMLKAAIRLAGVAHRRIESDMELSTGYLSRILSGKVELRVQHVVGICRAIGLPAAAFFEAAYPSRAFEPDVARLVNALKELMPEEGRAVARRSRKTARPGRPAVSRPAPRTSRREFRDARLRLLLRAVVAEMEKDEVSSAVWDDLGETLEDWEGPNDVEGPGDPE